IGLAQLEKAERLVAERTRVADRFSRELQRPEITPPAVRPGCTHVYYAWTARYDETLVGVRRDLFARALESEGVPVSVGYVAPLYLLPIFRERIGIGRHGFPFTLTNRSYQKGLCP